MRIGTKTLWLGWVSLLAGCASFQLDRANLSGRGVPDSAQVPNVPFLQQARNHCGPASLAMALGWAGDLVSAEELAGTMLTPGREGTFQMDVLSAARRRGFLALRVKNYESLFREIASGHPVLILQNLGLSWYPKWHYAVAIGYDLVQSQITLHSGSEAHATLGMKRFDLSWSLGEYWAVVVLPPTLLSPTADEVDHLEAAAALERIGLGAAASLAYQTILKRWPESLGAWIGMGNVRFAAGDLKGSAKALERAAQYHPEVPATWHNLALAYFSQHRLRAARAAARRALNLAKGADLVSYSESLQSVLPN